MKIAVNNIPSLTGLRAIAVLLVFVSHNNLGHIVPGGLGVSLFFFLSGYLITTLLRHEYLKKNRINIRQFYVRRVLRILPPMLLTIVLAVALTLAGLLEPMFSLAGLSSHLLFYTNYFMLLSREAIVPGCGAQWSLAVEEHFYMVFPLACSLFIMKMDRRKQILALGAVCIGVLINRSILASKGLTEWCYQATDARLDLILMGAMFALAWNPAIDSECSEPKRNDKWWFWASIAALLFSLVYRDQIFRDSWRFTLQGLAFFGVFRFVIVHHESKFVRWLDARPLVTIGNWSYMIYLCHQICYHLLSPYLGYSRLFHGIGAGLLALAISGLSYKYVETPIRNSKLRQTLAGSRA